MFCASYPFKYTSSPVQIWTLRQEIILYNDVVSELFHVIFIKLFYTSHRG